MAMTPYKEQQKSQPLMTRPLQPTGDPSGGRAIAGAFEAVGRGLGQMGQALDARDVLLADTEARAAYEGFIRERNSLLYDPTGGLLNRKGSNGADLVPNVQQGEGELQVKYGDGLSPRARKLFDERVTNVRLSDEEGAARYSSAQSEAYIVSGRQSTIALEVENAALAYADPAKFDQHVAAANREIAALGELQGWSSQQVQEEQNKATSTAVAAQVLRTATDDPLAAARVLEANRGRLSAQHQQQLDVALKDPVAEAQADAIVSSYIGPPDVVRPDAGARVLPRAGGQGGVEMQFAMGPRRPERPDDEVLMVVESAAAAVLGPGARVVVTSGTEGDRPQYGSARHKTGRAADVAFYDASGKKISVTDPRMKQIARAAAENGALGIGFGAEYMGGDHMHIDLVAPEEVGGGHVWGSGAKGAAGELVPAMRGDGPFSTAARRAPGLEALRRANVAATPLNEYFVNHLGTDTGIAVAQALGATPTRRMKDVDPRFNGDPSMTVGQYADAAVRQMGIDPRSTAGNYIDEAAAMAGIAQIEDPLVRRKAIAQLNEWIGLETKAKDATANAAFDTAWQNYKLTGSTEIPIADQIAMGPGKLASLQETMAKEQAGPLKTDMAVYEYLGNLAVLDREAFATTNLRDFYSGLTEADRRMFQDRQNAIQSDLLGEAAANDPALIPFEEHWSSAKDIIAPLGLQTTGAKAREEDQQRYLRLQQAYFGRLREIAEKEGRHPTFEEAQRAALELVTPVVINGRGMLGSASGVFGDTASLAPGETFSFDLEVTDLSVEERGEIVAALQRQGIQPTTQAVERAANERAALRLNGGVQNLDDIPPAVRDKLSELTSDPAEVIAMYNEWLLTQYPPE